MKLTSRGQQKGPYCEMEVYVGVLLEGFERFTARVRHDVYLKPSLLERERYSENLLNYKLWFATNNWAPRDSPFLTAPDASSIRS
jgi:hypothetical protein